MSHHYVVVQWNRKKVVYDLLAIAALVAHVALFGLVTRLVADEARLPNAQVLAMRAWGSGAFLMLSFVLAIGPLARLFPRALKPLLYNRRHLGVMVFFAALWHARQVLGFYQAFGSVAPIEALFRYDASFGGAAVPFQLFGAAALAILALMAASSHDFWQRVLGARRWKWLHMAVYPCYGLVGLHLAFGALRDGASGLHAALYLGAILAVGLLHLRAALAARRKDAVATTMDGELDGGTIAELEEGRPRRLLGPEGETIALVRHEGRVSALRAVCVHQGGPLDEGLVIDGCLTCPWHGWQYRPEDGCSPPPFAERIATHAVALDENGRLRVGRRPEPLDRPARPLVVSASAPARGGEAEDFFVGYRPMAPGSRRRSLAIGLAAALLLPGLGLLLATTQSLGGAGLRPWRSGESFRGILLEKPYPRLVYLDEDGRAASLLLVAAGKAGPALPPGLGGRAVEVAGGTLLQRDRSRMYAGGTIRETALAPAETALLAAAPRRELGAVGLEGEIVDSKCYFGAMRPGRGQIHRACAQICIEGGIPPLLALDGPDGEERHVLLADAAGEPVTALVLPFVAEPVLLRGVLEEHAGQLLLRFEPDDLRRP